MKRRATLGLAAGLLFLTGCMTDGEWSVEKVLGWDTPRQPKFSPASLQVAERVEGLGRRIVAQNTFTGLDPLFHTIGVPESMLFHRGTSELYVSEGLVRKCKTEAELAAVLCAELGRMMAEKRLARNLGRDKDTIPEVALPGGGLGSDGTRAAEVASQEKKTARDPAETQADPVQLAKELLTGAGFDPAELDRVEPLLKQTDRGDVLHKQMAGSAPAPTWEK
jgi:predicted Zn-dependent protease